MGVASIKSTGRYASGYLPLAKYDQTKKAWFLKFLDLSTGVAANDRFNAILASIKPLDSRKLFCSGSLLSVVSS